MSTANDIELADTASRGSDSSNGSKKRKLEDVADDIVTKIGMDQKPAALPDQPKLPEFNLTSTRPASRDNESPKEGSDGWQTVERPRKKAKKIPKSDSKNYPAIEFSSDSRLQTQVKLGDFQSLVLYILADGTSPQFVSVRHRPQIRKVVVLMIPGLEMDMFYKEKKDNRDGGEDQSNRREKDRRDRSYNPDDIYPKKLRSERLPPSLQPWAQMFDHVWSVKTPGDDKYGKMHSPLHAMLTAPAPKTKEEKDWKKHRKGVAPAKEPQGWKNIRVPIPEFIHSVEVLQENEYTIHPALYTDENDKAALLEHRRSNGVSIEHGWVDTAVKHIDEGTPPDNEIESGSITAGREIIAMDCEMCMTGEAEFSLTRISLVSWDGTVLMDELVKPAKPITDYVTQYVSLANDDHS